MKSLGLYFHVPFCISKCKYCDFYSIPQSNEELREKYIKALCRHIDEYKSQTKGYIVTSVYFGGGTPSLLSDKLFGTLMRKIKKSFRLSARCEISMEVNPGTVDFKKLKSFSKSGVNRISIGAQSFDDSLLKMCGRVHSSEDTYACVADAKKAGFENISLDVMFGLPGQSMQTLLDTAKCVKELNIPHVSLYGLKIEEGTPFWYSRHTLLLPDEDSERDMYFAAADALREAGLRQYEISNFAKPGKQCRHNMRYWNCDEYIGFGPAAHSYFGGKRFSFKKDIKLYIDSLDPEITTKEPLVDEYIDIPPSARMAEYVMLRFRLSEGVDAAKFKKRFGREFDEVYAERIRPFLQSGHIFRTPKGYAFTPEGMYVSNYILSRIVDFDLVIPGSDS